MSKYKRQPRNTLPYAALRYDLLKRSTLEGWVSVVNWKPFVVKMHDDELVRLEFYIEDDNEYAIRVGGYFRHLAKDGSMLSLSMSPIELEPILGAQLKLYWVKYGASKIKRIFIKPATARRIIKTPEDKKRAQEVPEDWVDLTTVVKEKPKKKDDSDEEEEEPKPKTPKPEKPKPKPKKEEIELAKRRAVIEDFLTDVGE